MGFGNVAAERRAIEATYEDTADFFRSTAVTDANNISRDVQKALHEGVHCALSKGANTSAEQKAQTVDHTNILFVAPEFLILPGDTVKVTRFGRMRNFIVLGFPDVYATHQEIRLKERGLA